MKECVIEMLTKIEVTNFKSFNEKFTFDLNKTNSFEFSKECVKDGIVSKALIYGQNGCGKSNLGFAIFDLISHLTDKNKEPDYYKNYLNADSNENLATFNFEFKFDDNRVTYTYTKHNQEILISEKIVINNQEFASIDRNQSSKFIVNAKGTETLNTDIRDSNISIISYISKNSILEENIINNTFNKFKKFINGMLYFRSLNDRCYIGFEQGSRHITNDIVNRDNLEDFEELLNNAGIRCKLESQVNDSKNELFFVFKNKKINFHEIASSGTQSLILFYFWYQRLKEDEGITFLFIDEFDAFYHHLLSKTVINKLKEITNTQILLTTHNTSLLTNDLLRPDCYFLMYEDKINSLSNSTPKELREAHNIEKMYKAGAFV